MLSKYKTKNRSPEGLYSRPIEKLGSVLAGRLSVRCFDRLQMSRHRRIASSDLISSSISVCEMELLLMNQSRSA